MDITNLTLEELKTLQNKVTCAINEKQNSGVVSAKKAFMESKEAKAIKKSALELKEAYVKLSKQFKQSIKFALAATVKVSAYPKYGEDEIYDSLSCERDMSDFVNVEVEGRLLHANRYDKKLVTEIQSGMNEIFANVCVEILRADKAVYNQLEMFTEKHNSLVNELEVALRAGGVYGRMSLTEIMEN